MVWTQGEVGTINLISARRRTRLPLFLPPSAIAETRATITIARLSQRRAESIQLAHVLRNAIDSIEGAGHGGAHDGASRQRQTD